MSDPYVTSEAVKAMIEANALTLVIYRQNPKSVLEYLNKLTPAEVCEVLKVSNPKAWEVYRHVRAWWEASKGPPAYADLAKQTGYSSNSCTLYVKLLRDVGLLKRIKGRGGHKDIVPWDRRGKMSSLYVLRLWAHEFPTHHLAKLSRKILSRQRGMTE